MGILDFLRDNSSVCGPPNMILPAERLASPRIARESRFNPFLLVHTADAVDINPIRVASRIKAEANVNRT